MGVPDQFQNVRIFFADDWGVAVLEEMACAVVLSVEIDGVPVSSFRMNNRTIDRHIKKLRRKIETIDPEAKFIHSVYGVAYKFESDWS